MTSDDFILAIPFDAFFSGLRSRNRKSRTEQSMIIFLRILRIQTYTAFLFRLIE